MVTVCSSRPRDTAFHALHWPRSPKDNPLRYVQGWPFTKVGGEFITTIVLRVFRISHGDPGVPFQEEVLESPMCNFQLLLCDSSVSDMLHP